MTLETGNNQQQMTCKMVMQHSTMVFPIETSRDNVSMHDCACAVISHCDITLAVPNTFGSSLGFNEPAPILGRVDCKHTILPPKGDYPIPL